ncbi:hypothetical protein V4F39_06455 [Aquincola sp. MAHUQ-54]|uniref:Uncharacterized protein n=1 Tax=Aquincola agrisoli TaxID=3119538 RepID=A0AAW9QDP9_9BURK
MPSSRVQAFFRTLRSDPGLRGDFDADAEAVMAEYALDEADRAWLLDITRRERAADRGAFRPPPGF